MPGSLKILKAGLFANLAITKGNVSELELEASNGQGLEKARAITPFGVWGDMVFHFEPPIVLLEGSIISWRGNGVAQLNAAGHRLGWRPHEQPMFEVFVEKLTPPEPSEDDDKTQRVMAPTSEGTPEAKAKEETAAPETRGAYPKPGETWPAPDGFVGIAPRAQRRAAR